MKVLLDPIYSGAPRSCSSAFKCRALVEYALIEKGRTDIFFYWLIPPWLDDQDRAWLPQHPNVRYIEFPYHKDRMREYLRFPDLLDMVEAFNGDFWDYDVLFTSRTSLIPFSRTVMSSPRQVKFGRKLKKIVCFEEMIVMDFRPTVAKSDVQSQELMTLCGYLAADLVFLQTEVEVQKISEAARRYFSPALCKQLTKTISLTTPMAFRDAKLKDEQFRYKGGRPFCVSFAGRLESVSSNLSELFRLMTAKFALGGDKIKLLICTVTKQSIAQPPSAAEVRVASREEFWRAAREEMDVMLVLHTNAEFSLSLVEPALLGVPLIVIDKPWSRSVYGPDYPFYARDVAHAYALINVFQKDYATQYAKFAKWQQECLRTMFAEGGVFGGDMFQQTYRLIAKHADFLSGGAASLYQSRQGTVDLARQILAEAESGGLSEFVLFDVIEKLAKKKQLEILGGKIAQGDRNRRRLVFSTPWHEFKVIFQLMGWEDASTTVGHFRRKSEPKITA